MGGLLGHQQHPKTPGTSLIVIPQYKRATAHTWSNLSMAVEWNYQKIALYSATSQVFKNKHREDYVSFAPPFLKHLNKHALQKKNHALMFNKSWIGLFFREKQWNWSGRTQGICWHALCIWKWLNLQTQNPYISEAGAFVVPLDSK